MERLDSTIAFLRMAVIVLRRIAESSPEIAEQLLGVVRQLEAEADDLSSNPPA